MPFLPLPGPPPVSLHYEDRGEGGPALLLIHGSFTRGDESFAALMPRLAPRRRVLCPDLRGHGRSESPSLFWDAPLLARDLWAFLDALNAPRAHLVGHSMGGDVALLMAASAPERTLSLVSIGSGGSANPGLVRYLDKLERLEGSGRLEDSPFFAKLADDHMPAHRGDWRTFFRVTIESCMRHPQLTDADLARLTMPVLLVRGSLDELVSDDEVERLARRCPDFRCETLVGAGHAPQRGERFSPALADMLLDFAARAEGG